MSVTDYINDLLTNPKYKEIKQQWKSDKPDQPDQPDQPDADGQPAAAEPAPVPPAAEPAPPQPKPAKPDPVAAKPEPTVRTDNAKRVFKLADANELNSVLADMKVLSHGKAYGLEEREQKLKDDIEQIQQQFQQTKSEIGRKKTTQLWAKTLFHLAAGLYGIKNGVDVSGAKFELTDWAAELDQRRKEALDKTDTLKSEYSREFTIARQRRQEAERQLGLVEREQYTDEKRREQLAMQAEKLKEKLGKQTQKQRDDAVKAIRKVAEKVYKQSKTDDGLDDTFIELQKIELKSAGIPEQVIDQQFQKNDTFLWFFDTVKTKSGEEIVQSLNELTKKAINNLQTQSSGSVVEFVDPQSGETRTIALPKANLNKFIKEQLEPNGIDYIIK